MNDQIKRLAGLVAMFFIFVAAGVVSFRLIGGGFGRVSHDAYKMLQLFVLSGDWVFGENANWFVRVQAFIAPVFTVIGIIEIFTAQFFFRLWQSIKLARMRNHAVLVGLTHETMYLAASLRNARERIDAVIIDLKFEEDQQAAARRIGVVTIAGDPSSQLMLKKAKIHRAKIALSFLPEAADSLQFVLSANAHFDRRNRSGAEENAPSVDLWVRLQDAGLGNRLSQYFKFAGLSAAAHPRFFSIEEIAARRLVRAHPPDVYADALGQERIHIVLFGYNALTVQVIGECLRQTTNGRDGRTALSIITQSPEETERDLRALFPSIDEMASLDVRTMKAHASGLSQHEYDRLPKDATVYVICHSRPETSVNIALSLRRMLLSPPESPDGNRDRRTNAPILVRLADTRGIGELLRSNVDQRTQLRVAEENEIEDSEIPDGIYAFGAVEDLLTGDKDDLFVPTLIDPVRERLARALHASYVADLEPGDAPSSSRERALSNAQRSWELLPQEFRESNRQAADHIWSKARAIRLRLSPKGGQSPPIRMNAEEQQALAELEHNRWVNERFLNGWARSEKRVDAARRHNLLRPWSELSANERRMDQRLADRLTSMVESIGLSFKREFVIGVVGHRPSGSRPFDRDFVEASLRRKLKELLAAHPDRSPLVLTSLAAGADMIAAEVALELGVPYWAPLPMPYEAYCQDFSSGKETGGAPGRTDGRDEISQFRRLVALSERYLEIPLKFGALEDVSLSKLSDDHPMARRRQYALAAAFIVERSDALLAVWDGLPSKGVGGTADAVEWRNAGAVPLEYATPAEFRLRPKMSPTIVIPPTCPEAIDCAARPAANSVL